MSKNLFKEAIADAKAVRETALANAKMALEESLTPKLQTMLAHKLQEMEEEKLDEENQIDVNENEDSDDFDLAEILAELDKEDEAEGNLGEAAEDDAPLEDEDDAPLGLDDEAPADLDMGPEGEEEDINIADMSVEDLKDLIKSVVSDELAAGDEFEGGEDEFPADGGEDLGLEDEGGMDDEMAGGEDDEDIDLNELLAELESIGESKDDELEEAKKKEDKSELKEALATINTLRSELQEVNLFNAKMLYVNKIFKSKNLSEGQKIKVLASFDKATTISETKVVYESLNNTLVSGPKKAITESRGSASKAAGVAPAKPAAIVEANDITARFQKLAGINKY